MTTRKEIVTTRRRVTLDLTRLREPGTRFNRRRLPASLHTVPRNTVRAWMTGRPRVILVDETPTETESSTQSAPPPSIWRLFSTSMGLAARQTTLAPDYVSRQKTLPKSIISEKENISEEDKIQEELDERNRLLKKWNLRALLLILFVVLLGLAAVAGVTVYFYYSFVKEDDSSTTTDKNLRARNAGDQTGAADADQTDSRETTSPSIPATDATPTHGSRAATSNPSLGHYCLHGGKPILSLDGDFSSCVCAGGFFGSRCQFANATLGACAAFPCKESTCTEDGANFKCSCASGFHGNLCHIKVEECDRIFCSNGGSCVEGACRCTPGFGGYLCRRSLDFHLEKNGRGQACESWLDCDRRPGVVGLECILVAKIGITDCPR